MDSVDSCKLCFLVFDDSVRPRCLPCGHSFCTSCLNNVIEGGKIACPNCKQIHRAVTANEFPINYDLEELITSSKGIEAQEETTFRSSKMQTIIEEQMTSAQTVMDISEEIETHVKEYDSFLLNAKSKHGDILQQIKDLSKRNQVMMHDIDEERAKIGAILKEVGFLREKMKIKMPDLDKGTNTKSVVVAIAELDQNVAALEEWNELSRSQLPNAKIISSSLKVLVESISAMSIVDPSAPEVEVPDFSNMELTILEKIEKIRGNGTLNFQKLKSLSDPLRKSLEEGKVYAMQSDQGKARSARLSISEKGVCLHYLKDGEPPSHVHTIKHSELIENLNKDATVVFMDLSWEGALKGRIHILLHPDTPLARQFRILCTAELGPSYVCTRFYNVGGKSQYNECLIAGDYQFNNGNGGASVINLKGDDDSYTRQLREGIVYAPYGTVDGPQGAQFNIITGVGNVLVNLCHVFGQVQEGINVLKAAVNAPLGQVEISDCGVLLPI